MKLHLDNSPLVEVQQDAFYPEGLAGCDTQNGKIEYHICAYLTITSSGGSRKQSKGVLKWFAHEAHGKFLPTTPTFPKPHFNL